MLVFVRGGKFESPLDYKLDDLRTINHEAADKPLSFVCDDAHKEQKLGIIEGTLRTMLEGWPRERRLVRLLSFLPEFEERVRDGDKLFITEFSFQPNSVVRCKVFVFDSRQYRD